MKEFIPYIVIVAVVIFIRAFIVTPVRVDGISMEPTLKDNDILMLKRYDRSYEYGDIVILNYGDSKLVKRIIGIPGDSLKYKNGKLYINGKKQKDSFSVVTSDFNLNELGYEEIPEGYYFVLGDNRMSSSDSRMIGLIKENDIIGTTTLRIFPLTHLGFVK